MIIASGFQARKSRAAIFCGARLLPPWHRPAKARQGKAI
jgi:hypothetical protein